MTHLFRNPEDIRASKKKRTAVSSVHQKNRIAGLRPGIGMVSFRFMFDILWGNDTFIAQSQFMREIRKMCSEADNSRTVEHLWMFSEICKFRFRKRKTFQNKPSMCLASKIRILLAFLPKNLELNSGVVTKVRSAPGSLSYGAHKHKK